MTDGRFPDRWLTDRRFAQVSAEAFVLFVVANTWSASNRTDGDIRRDDLALFPRWVGTDRAHELVKAELWMPDRDGWQIAGYDATQTTAAQLDAAEQARANNRERQARKRLRDRTLTRRDSRRDVARDDTGQDRTGQDRTGTGAPEPDDNGWSDDVWRSLAPGYDH